MVVKREPRRVTVLGSTGSVGMSTMDLLARSPGRFAVEALTANTNVERLAAQARKFGARLAVVADAALYKELKAALSDSGVEAAAGPEAVVEAARRPAEWVMAAIVGAAGLPSTMAAVERGALVALANKESLVCAGALMISAVARSGAKLLPVDSEHNAIFQALAAGRPEDVERIILTASGGPFRDWDRARMSDVSPSAAVAHPVWDMGAKISIDSATMMNKGLELIEAHHLFHVPSDRIDILVHPQSVVHSLVAYVDGSVLAQLGTPDMRTPIAHTLAWPERMPTPSARLDLAALGSLTFERPDAQRFPALRLARECLDAGGASPIVLNAANEVAVKGFLDGRIGFLDIAASVEETLASLPFAAPSSIADVIEIDRGARERAGSLLRRRNAFSAA